MLLLTKLGKEGATLWKLWKKALDHQDHWSGTVGAPWVTQSDTHEGIQVIRLFSCEDAESAWTLEGAKTQSKHS